MYETLLLAGAVTLIVLWLSLKFFAQRKVQNLQTKYVFITGCDSGFGRETAIRLDKMGVHVLAACLTKQGAQDLKSVTSDKLKTFQMDVTDSQQIKDVFRQVKNLLPSGQGVWGLVNNAGIAIAGPIEWTPLEHMKRSADVNLWGMIDVTKTFLPLIKKSQGRVVNMSSLAGRTTLCLFSAYCISKYGVEAFSDALRREMSPWGVLVSVLEPGLFQTSIGDQLTDSVTQFWSNLTPEVKEDYEDKRIGGIAMAKGMQLSIEKGSSPDTYKVVDAIVAALTSQRPQTRYVVGLDGKLMVFLSYLPTFIADYVLRVKQHK
ncbi:retinol dehydrogenase 7-like [Orbicella faveolata]|uniref:retinol dehydrogenase 7-like n=1 Tax=Orbicella faveolata TaxID=48498 RepID=UPI0009E286FB|nr:retinol dehydrogenase 7-like [Orbicella faveolata]